MLSCRIFLHIWDKWAVVQERAASGAPRHHAQPVISESENQCFLTYPAYLRKANVLKPIFSLISDMQDMLKNIDFLILK